MADGPFKSVGDGSQRDILFDISRLIWRAWRGGIPTGIDRVCLAYAEHYRSRALAVVQRGGAHLVFTPEQSDNLFAMLLSGRSCSKLAITSALVRALPGARTGPPQEGMIYLNVGHTGLHEPSLPYWLRRHGLHPIYLIHDLIPLTHPRYCRPGEETKHRHRMNNALATGAGIIGNSQTSLDELAQFAAASGHAMPPSVAAWLSGPPPRRVQPSINRTAPYFLVVGTIEGRKNHRVLLDAWRELIATEREKTPDLLIVGQRGWQAEDVFRTLDQPHAFGGHVEEIGACEDDELANLLACARALLMPSHAEGFGLPVVEALQVGTPVIASDLPVFREIAGDIPMYVDPANPSAWVDAVRHLLIDDREVDRQREQMRDFRAPVWEDHFAKVDRWLSELDLTARV